MVAGGQEQHQWPSELSGERWCTQKKDAVASHLSDPAFPCLHPPLVPAAVCLDNIHAEMSDLPNRIATYQQELDARSRELERLKALLPTYHRYSSLLGELAPLRGKVAQLHEEAAAAGEAVSVSGVRGTARQQGRQATPQTTGQARFPFAGCLWCKLCAWEGGGRLIGASVNGTKQLGSGLLSVPL
jgi:hypothetical protein